MRSIAIGVALAAFAPALSLAGEAGTKPEPSAALYDQLVAKAGQIQPDVDYTLLRLSYAQTAGYDPYGGATRALFSDTWNALQTKDCQTVMTKSDAFLKIDFTRAPVHIMRETCFEQQGDKSDAARELAIGRGLTESLLGSGDGKSPATAYVVVTMSEEGYVMTFLGMNEEQQALIQDDKGYYDFIQGEDEHGNKKSVYFNVTLPFTGMGRQLESGKPPL
ncbi:MAG TPA: DUF4919 domain-containing protein [Rhizomicrobium sp.]|nr:DUF4919 domain-containing protein [Rhizomicrobium sp.]